MRAVVSFGPPAAKPTTQWIGRLGYLSAARPIPKVIADMPITATAKASRRAARIALSLGLRPGPVSTAVSLIDLRGYGKAGSPDCIIRAGRHATMPAPPHAEEPSRSEGVSKHTDLGPARDRHF